MSKVNETSANDNVKDKEHIKESVYLCNICLDTAQNAVVSMCGHLFCWPCLHKWLLMSPNPKLCPVCKSAIAEDKVIPLYGRNNTQQEDPRKKVPPRPVAQRIEPQPAAELPRMRFGIFLAFGMFAPQLGGFTSMFDYRILSRADDNANNNEPSLFAFIIHFFLQFFGWMLF